MCDPMESPKPSSKAKLVAVYSTMEVMFWLNTIRSRKFMTPSGGVVQTTRTLKLFKNKGLDCAFCGMKGEIFKEWTIDGSNFLCLYGITYTNRGPKHVLMTADHIFPKSLGGTDKYKNLQPMCSICNNKKGNIIQLEYIELEDVCDYEVC